MDKQFSSFIHNFIKQYQTNIFNDKLKCKSLLLDHAKGEYKNEIRLLMQALDMGCYANIMNSNDLNITRMSLIKQLQLEYYISDSIATSLIDMLLMELRNYKTEQDKQPSKTKPKKKISNQLNVSSQEEPLPISMHDTNKSNIDTDVIYELGSIISNKVDNERKIKNEERKKINSERRKELYSLRRFKDKAKNIYEPTFIEYQEIMKKNKLKCKYSNSEKSIKFYFLFVNNVYKDSKATYTIIKKNSDIVKTSSNFSYYSNKDISDAKDYNIKLLTKEVIINELTLFTEKILEIVKVQLNLTQILHKQEPAINNQPLQKDLLASSELKDLISYIDVLLDYVPEEKIKKFAFSEQYDLYKNIFKENKSISTRQKAQIKDLFSHIEELLEFLPSEKINLFVNSEHYETYKKLFNYLGLVYWRIS